MPKIRGFAGRDRIQEALRIHFRGHVKVQVGDSVRCSCGWSNTHENFVEHLALATANLIHSAFYIYARHPKPK